MDKGYGHPHILKSTTSSPLVYIDKTEGRYHYKYSLIGHPVENTPPLSSARDRYREFLIKLRRLSISETDQDIESKRRTEQHLLQKWLFEGKTHEKCAICGRDFHITSLVTAHKKKRSICKESERLDPNIVMPICLFGCDHLYEIGEIRVESGVVVKGNSGTQLKMELDYISSIVGNRLERKWLEGDESYFA